VLSEVHALGRSFLLPVVLVAVLVWGAIHPHRPSDDPPTEVRVLNALIVLAAIYTLSGRRWTLRVAMLLAVPVLVTDFGPHRTGDEERILDLIRIPCSLLFNLFTCALIMHYSVRGDAQVRHRLVGAACAYVLLGLSCASAFAMVDAHAGPAFNFNGQPATGMSWNDFRYYSLITLTTVGYGDFTPVHPIARVLAMIEAAVGVMFVAVAVSALVGEALALKSSGRAAA
jgi:hypothetical protein